MLVVDTDILVDILRAVPPAVEWFRGISEVPCVPGFVALELYEGCRNERDVRDVDALLSPLPILWPSSEQCERIRLGFSQWKLRDGCSAFDALIAGCALEINATLLTFNRKHYRAIEGLLMESPYRRSKPV